MNQNKIIKTKNGNVVKLSKNEIYAMKKAQFLMTTCDLPKYFNQWDMRTLIEEDLRLISEIIEKYEKNDKIVEEKILLEHKEIYETIQIGKLIAIEKQ